MTERRLAVLGTGLVDPDLPLLRADDLGVLRGDGIFETLLVRDGAPWLLGEHLARLDRSAGRMDLPAPPASDWRDLVATIVAGWPPHDEGILRLVCTRGLEEGGPVTAYAVLGPVPASVHRQRSAGVRVVTRSLGLSADVRQGAPWLLGGVKSISYAVAMAALRDARRLGADDVIWTSTEGQVLEGPTASVVWARGETLHTVPVETGILDGTTVAHLLAIAPACGFDVVVRRISIAELHLADAVWLLSSVRGVARVLSIDGRERGDAGLTERVRKALGFC